MAPRKMLTYFQCGELQFICTTKEENEEMENIKHSFLHHTMPSAFVQ